MSAQHVKDEMTIGDGTVSDHSTRLASGCCVNDGGGLGGKSSSGPLSISMAASVKQGVEYSRLEKGAAAASRQPVSFGAKLNHQACARAMAGGHGGRW